MKRITFFFLALSFLLIKNTWSQDTIVFRPGPEGKDALINTIVPNVNYENTEVFKCMAWTHSGVPGTNRALIAFDLSFIPSTSFILQASFNLYFATFEPTYVPHTGENASYLLRITSPWEEDEVTWNNQPMTTMEDLVVLPQSTYPEQDYTDIDITNLVQLMVSDPEHNYGLMLRLITEEYYRCLMFASGDYLNSNLWPKLEIIYISCEPPTVDFEYQVDGATVSFTGISPTATSWHWDFGDGDTSDIQNPEHNYQLQGIYQVCLRVDDTCYFTEHCEMVTVCDMLPPESGFTYLIDDLTVFFQDTSIMADEYFWDFGDGYFSNLSNPSHIYNLPGNYQVCLTTWNGCGADTVCEVVNLCMPVSEFTYSIEDLNVFFQDASMIADEFFWDFGDGYFSNLSDPWHHYELPGNYLVCLQTWNECGSDTACEMIDLTPVSISESANSLFMIYPNPARDEIFIKSSFKGPITVSLLDLIGKEVLLQNKDVTSDETIEIPLGQVEPGLYIIRFDSGKTQAYGKLVVM